MSESTPRPDGELLARDVMSPDVVTLRADASIAEAWQTLYASGRTHLVATDRGRCAGVVDDRVVALEWPGGAFESRRRQVSALFRGTPATVLPDTAVQDVARLMTRDGVSAVAVVNESGRPLGLIRAVDLVAALARIGLAVDARWVPTLSGIDGAD